jgi:hypothetical protein
MFLAAACSNSNDGGATTAAGSTGGTGGIGSGTEAGGMGGGGTSSTSGGAGGTTSGSGGSVSPACAAAPYNHSFDFGAIFEGWEISSFSSPNLVPMTPMGSGGTTSGAGGDSAGGDSAGGEGGEGPSGEGGAPSPTLSGTLLELDTSDGAPDSPDGSLKLTIPFDGPSQLLLLGHVFNTGLNFTGTLVTAQIKLDSGLVSGPSDTATASLVLKATEGYIYYGGPSVVLDPSAGWVTLSIDPDTPTAESVAAGYYACDVREIDIEIHTGETGSYQEAVVHLDAIAVAPKAP